MPYGLDFSTVQDRSNSVTLEKQLLRLDDSQFWANISFSAIQFDKEELFMSTIIDISDRKEAEAMMAYLNDHDQLTDVRTAISLRITSSSLKPLNIGPMPL